MLKTTLQTTLNTASRVVVTVALGVAGTGCSKNAPPPSAPAEAAPEPAAVVPNVEAKPGDVTTCPFSGRTFVVKAEHPKVEYKGKTYTICSEKAAASVEEDPARYLDDFEG